MRGGLAAARLLAVSEYDEEIHNESLYIAFEHSLSHLWLSKQIHSFYHINTSQSKSICQLV